MASEENKQIARSVANVFGGAPKVTRYWDENHTSSVHLLECADRPESGTVSYSTVNLSDTPLIVPEDGSEFETRLEIVGAAHAEDTEYANAVASAAFAIINDREFAFPGRIFPGSIAINQPDLTMRHLLLVPPYLWNDRPETMDLPGKTVAFLQAIPISDAEMEHAASNGSDALEDLFERHQPDVFDLTRPSVL